MSKDIKIANLGSNKSLEICFFESTNTNLRPEAIDYLSQKRPPQISDRVLNMPH